jgi:glycosyltransferase involved in cell wall biosynthesis
MTICTDTGAHDPTVTIVIPAYNSAHYISQTLDSVLAQTFTDYEVILVNDGSDDRDELEQILDSHPLPVIYLSQENKGVSAARNAAIKIARGKYYAQLDADDQWTPDYLKVQLAILAQNPEVALVYPNATIIGDSSEVGLELMKLTPSEGEVNFESLVRQECVVMTCVTARMSAIRDAGMFDEELRSCEDFDLWLRVVKNVGPIIYHREPLVLYRRHAGSLSSDRVWMLRHLLRVFEKCGRTLDLTHSERKALDQEISLNRSLLHVTEGKRNLNSRQANAALEDFEQANQHLHSKKLGIVIFLLRYMPRLTMRMFNARERLMTGQAHTKLTGIDQPRLQ